MQYRLEIPKFLIYFSLPLQITLNLPKFNLYSNIAF